jgi:hypothetical protein
MVRESLGRPDTTLRRSVVDRVDYEVGSPTTEGLFRVHRTAVDHGEIGVWSFFVKVLRSLRR